MAETDTEKTTPIQASEGSKPAGGDDAPAKAAAKSPAKKTTKKSSGSASKSADKDAEKSAEKSTSKSTGKSSTKSAEKSTSKSTKSSSGKSSSASKAGSKSGTSAKSKASGESKSAAKSSESGATAKKKTTGESKTAGTKAAGTKSAGTKTTGTKTTGSKTAGTKATGTKTAGSKSAGTKTAGSKTEGAKKTSSKTTGAKKTTGTAGKSGTASKRSTSSGAKKASLNAEQIEAIAAAAAVNDTLAEPETPAETETQPVQAAEPETAKTEEIEISAAPEDFTPDADEIDIEELPAPAEEPVVKAPEEETLAATEEIPEQPEHPATAEEISAPAEELPARQPETTTKKDEPRRRRSIGAFIGAAVLPLTLMLHEIVFRMATSGSVLKYSLIPTLLFCLIYGLAGTILAGLTKSSGFNKAVKIVLIAGSAVLFSTEYFIYREFKVLYDIKTILFGAGGVASGFMDQAMELILSPTGILFIVLMLLPLILYLIFGLRKDKAARLGKKGFAAAALTLVAAIALNTAAINAVDIYKYSYGSRYNFQSAVEKFGFLTGLRLDMTRSAGTRGATGYDYEADAGETDPDELPEFLHVTVSNVTKTAAQGKLVYDKNVLDIDFKALGDSAGGALQAMDNYVSAQEPSSQNEMTGLFKGKNLIFISAEAFSAEAIDPVRTPTLYRMATKGINFTDYYQPASAGTTGGEFENIFGMLPMSGGASMGEMTNNLCWYTMSYQLNMLGYYGIAYHNNDYMFYNRHVTHNKLGYSEGYYGLGNGLEGKITEQWPESDLEMVEATIDDYIEHQPFNVYYMSVSGHSGYSYGGNAMTRKNWDSTEGYEGSDTVRSYLACNVELDKAMEYLLARLEDKGIADDTVIVIGADHFPYGLDTSSSLGNMPYLSELYGHNVVNMMDRDHNRLIIWSGCLEDPAMFDEPIVVDTPTFSLDILPTLLNLYGIPFDSRVLVGRDVFSNRDPLVFNLNHDWKTDKGTYEAWTDTFTPAEGAGDIPSDYVPRMNTIVANKINYCSDVIARDYYRHLFG